MAEPVSFTSTSARFALPLLFAGQAQKEFFINEALCRADALLHPVIEGEADTPPEHPAAGEGWLVGSSPTGAWSGHAGSLASYQAESWVFVIPRDGMRVLDRSTGQDIRYWDGWQRPSAPEAPAGGVIVDSEARAAIVQLIAALTAAGFLL